MALFKPRTVRKDNTEPFLDHVVTMMSDDPISYVGIKGLKNSDVFASVSILASDIASSPVQVIDKDTIKENDSLSEMINYHPNPLMTGWHFKFSLVANMLLNGDSFAEIKRNQHDEPIGLIMHKNSTINMKQRQNGTIYYVVSDDDKPKREVNQMDMLHFKHFTHDGLTGVSPLLALADELRVQKAGNKTIHNFFSKGINGSGILKVHKSDLDSEAKKAIREKFEEANGSNDGDNAQRTIIMDEGMDYTSLEINTDVLKLINSSDWTTKQIAKAFGIPNERLGVESHHSNTTQTNVMYLQNTLVHYYRSIASELKAKLGKQFKFNSDFLFEADPESMTDTIVDQYINGLITLNEARTKLGYQPKEEGNETLDVNTRRNNYQRVASE